MTWCMMCIWVHVLTPSSTSAPLSSNSLICPRSLTLPTTTVSRFWFDVTYSSEFGLRICLPPDSGSTSSTQVSTDSESVCHQILVRRHLLKFECCVRISQEGPINAFCRKCEYNLKKLQQASNKMVWKARKSQVLWRCEWRDRRYARKHYRLIHTSLTKPQ